MTGDDDRAAQQELDEAPAPHLPPRGVLDPGDARALYSLVYSALGEEDQDPRPAPVPRIEKAIARIESGRLHPVEIIVAFLAAVVGIALAAPALAALAGQLHRVLGAPDPSVLLAVAGALVLVAALDRLLQGGGARGAGRRRR